MVCSARKHPLSSVSGRRRYNTLDFPTENRVPTGRFHPYWKPRIKGICHPFEIPARLRICTHKLKKRVCDHRSINVKNPTVDPPVRRGKTVGFSLCRIHWNGSNSCVTQRLRLLRSCRILTRILAKGCKTTIPKACPWHCCLYCCFGCLYCCFSGSYCCFQGCIWTFHIYAVKRESD